MSDKGDFRTRDVTKDRGVTTLQDIVTQGQHTTCDLQHADTHGKTEMTEGIKIQVARRNGGLHGHGWGLSGSSCGYGTSRLRISRAAGNGPRQVHVEPLPGPRMGAQQPWRPWRRRNHTECPPDRGGGNSKNRQKIPESQKCNQVVLSHPWAKETGKYFKLSKNENTPSHNWWGKAKSVLEGNVSLNASIRKDRAQIDRMLPP